jgi:hypothetical protein
VRHSPGVSTAIFSRSGVADDDAERTAQAIIDLFIDGIAKR